MSEPIDAARRVAVKVPTWGLTMDDAVVQEWMVGEGEVVQEGEVVAVIETDKPTGEVEARASGRLVAIAAQEGDSVRSGAVIGEIERT